jgi:hypothetical protein
LLARRQQSEVTSAIFNDVIGAKNGMRLFLSAFPPCLSRACLGKMIAFLYKNGSKMPFFAGRSGSGKQ